MLGARIGTRIGIPGLSKDTKFDVADMACGFEEVLATLRAGWILWAYSVFLSVFRYLAVQ
jgi:hypothetical protein